MPEDGRAQDALAKPHPGWSLAASSDISPGPSKPPSKTDREMLRLHRHYCLPPPERGIEIHPVTNDTASVWEFACLLTPIFRSAR